MVKGNDINLVFTGDLCCHNRFAYTLENGQEIISNQIKSFLQDADYAIFNFEGSTFGNTPVSLNVSNLRNSQRIVTYLKESCNPVFNLANNHTMDYGEVGLKKTISYFKEKDLPWFGAGYDDAEALKPFVIRKNGIQVNVWGVNAYKTNEASKSCFGINGIGSLQNIKKEIRKQNGVQKNIICMHGGEEFTFYPMPCKRFFLQNIAKSLCPDVIICHHSHTFQGIEKIGQTIIFHSLGNFMFDYPSHSIYERTKVGMLVNLTISKDELKYSLAGTICDLSQPVVNTFNLRQVPNIDKYMSLESYNAEVEKDAYRVVFESKKRRSIVFPSIEVSRSGGSAFINKLKLLKNILNDRFLVSLYYRAFKYLLLKKYGK